ncbi:MAG TPA: L-serine ammonia-lyase, iron-sulfur-dependent, subunit alpha [Selenomonadales bacterium]|nr:L-serine ammonia-lyase, iron-sulfur-dependent, subunit alpha [Selenomonadales bacterium]
MRDSAPRQAPSIFNDVLGPIMTGPSSSHTAAPTRIGKMALQLLDGKLAKAVVTFEAQGSFAACYQSQCSDKGLIGGLLGWDPEDERIPSAERHAEDQGVDVVFQQADFPADHPNTAKITVESTAGETVSLVALSVGGGMIEIIEVAGFAVSMAGDYYELLVFVPSQQAERAATHALRLLAARGLSCRLAGQTRRNGRTLLNVKSSQPVPAAVLEELKAVPGVKSVKYLTPVLPVISQQDSRVPFRTAAGMLAAATPGTEPWELAVRYESARGGMSETEVLAKTRYALGKMKAAVKLGLSGELEMERILRPQAHLVAKANARAALVPAGVVNTVIAWSMAVLEVNSAMGVVVAAPTAGSCGVVPGAVLGSAKEMGLTEDDEVKALLAAGLIGVFIAEQATFSAEVCGCQAECGAASAMAAAGVVQLAGGTARQAATAASIALQNVLGLVCDPIAALVEVPCLGKNVLGAVNAVAAANMALAGVDEIVPLDETIQAMAEVGGLLPAELRCTGLGGLAATPSARAIAEKLLRR